MSSLSVHLRLPEDHSGLRFHPSCPICRRDRLAGSLGGDEIVSRRTQAAIAASLLAFPGLAAPSAAVAAGPEQDIDGTSEVVESPDADAPDLDETAIGWTDGGTAPVDDEAPASVLETEDGSLEEAATEPVDEPLIEAAGDTEEPAEVAEPAETVAAPPAEEPTATTEVPEPEASDDIRVDIAEHAKRERPVNRTKPAVQPRVIAPPPPAAPAPAAAAPAPVAPRTIRVVAGAITTGGRAEAGDRFHTVQRGESLWSIASDVLGDGASVTSVAREVNRLWELNEDRIATGSPDLLFAGTRLRLR
jgi:nucleoid-associated protein YgaU